MYMVINEFHKKNMISIVLKTFLQIKRRKRNKLFKSYKRNMKMGSKKEILYISKIVSVLYYGF